MRAFILLVAIVAVCNTASAMPLNCTAMPMPAHNFYHPSGNCSGDPAIKSCLTAFDTCSALAANKACALGVSACLTPMLRCFEAAMPKSQECSMWASQLNNEKLYLAAGGEYNGSSLDASCKLAACHFANMSGAHSGCIGEAAAACVDPMFSATTPAPAQTRPATAALVTFRLSGTKAMYEGLIADATKKAALETGVKKVFSTILQTSAAEIFLESMTPASLVVVFFTTAAIDANTVRQRMVDAEANPPAGLFTELSALTGETIGIESFSVEPPTGETLPPLTPTPATPTPGSGASAATIVAAVLALVCLAL